MVNGLVKFREWFQGFESQYVIIGGTACDLVMENEELPFRSTKDIDMVLIIESLTNDFIMKFWEFIEEANYEHLNRNTGKPEFYRFMKPKNKNYPFMIELFSRSPKQIIVKEKMHLTPLPMEEGISSLSAILLNEVYYELLKEERIIIEGIPILSPYSLILFKVKAWLDLNGRKQEGQSIDTKKIRKHRNDIFRLAQLVSPQPRTCLNPEIINDVQQFLFEMEKENIDFKSLDIRGIDQEGMLTHLKRVFWFK